MGIEYVPEPPGDTQPEEYFGRSPEKEEARDYQADKIDERRLDGESSASEHRVLLLEEQLAEVTRQLRQLQKKDGAINVDDVARVAEEDAWYRKWRRYYKIVEERGGICTIALNPATNPAANRPVPVCVNGHWYYLKRGEPIQVPVQVLEALVNAIQVTLEPLVDGNGEVHHTIVKRQSYPFMAMNPPAHQILGM